MIGNAAHQLHPVAGQGLNLGLRDVATLAQVIANAQQQGEPLGSLHTLENYARWRHADHLKIVGFTDGVNRVFSNTWAPLSVLRNLGLVALDAVPAFKKSLAHLTMGLDGRLPNLVRGLPLQD